MTTTKTYTAKSGSESQINQIHRDGAAVSWTLTGTDPEGRTYTTEYHTDRHGEGLWIGHQQIQGNRQFRVPASKSGARAYIVRFFEYTLN